MRLVFRSLPGAFLWLLYLWNVISGMPSKEKTNVHFTNIGDISTKDLLRIADASTPADKRFLSSDATQQNDIETERNQYYEGLNNNMELTTPNDQEERFVNLLKHRYRGTFPEYSKETEADYSKNQELADNLDSQPETVFFGHSDAYHGKNGDTSDFHIPDDVPHVDNLDTFDSDSNHMDADMQKMKSFHDKTSHATEAPSHTTARQQTDQSVEDYELQNDGTTPGVSEDEEETPGTAGDWQQDEETGDDGATQELEKLKEKTKDKLLSMKTKSSRKIWRDKNKVNKEEKLKSKGKSNESDSTGILGEFEKLKDGNKITKEHKGNGGDNVGSTGTAVEKQSPKHQADDISSKKIRYIHTDDSQATGDAILDFLDKLLDKDPQKLRHDVLSMAKEMQSEGSDHKTPRKTTKRPSAGYPANVNKNKEVDKWISEMEHGIIHDKGGQIENSDSYGNDEDSEVHDQPQDIYPDRNGEREGEGETYWNELENDDVDTGRKIQAEKVEEKMEDKVEQQKEQFDYEEFKEEALKMHNEFRKRHNAVALEWSEKLAKKAHEIAMQLIHATTNTFKRELIKEGESIAILPYLTKNIAKKAVEKWYSEITKFSFADPGIKPETRDFTQIIWKGTKQVGMAFAYSADKKKTLVVALYTPAGNNKEEISKNLNLADHDPYADIRKAAIGRTG